MDETPARESVIRLINYLEVILWKSTEEVLFGKQNAFDFKPKNVGDELEEDSMNYPQPMHDPEAGEGDYEEHQEYNQSQGYESTSRELAQLRDTDQMALKQNKVFH